MAANRHHQVRVHSRHVAPPQPALTPHSSQSEPSQSRRTQFYHTCLAQLASVPRYSVAPASACRRPGFTQFAKPMQLTNHQPHLGRASHRASRECRPHGLDAAGIRPQQAPHRRHQLVHTAVALKLDEAGHVHGAGLTHPACTQEEGFAGFVGWCLG